MEPFGTPAPTLSSEFCAHVRTPQGFTAFGPWLHSLGYPFSNMEAVPFRLHQIVRSREEDFACQTRVLQRMSNALKDAGIPAWIVDGPYVASRYYERPVFRPLSTVRLLVLSHRWHDFLRVVQGLGGAFEPSRRGSGLETIFLEECQFKASRGLFSEEILTSLPRSCSRTSEVPGLGWFRELELSPLFVFLCSEVFYDFEEALGSLVDLDQICRQTSLNWKEIFDLAERFRVKRALLVTLVLLRRHLGTPVPEDLAMVPWPTALLAWHLSPRLFRGRAEELGAAARALLQDSWVRALAGGLGRSLIRSS